MSLTPPLETVATTRAVAPLRLAMISYRLPVAGQKRGGVDQVAHDLADGLARLGHMVEVWTYDPRPEGARYTVRPLPGRAFFESWLGCRLTIGYLGNVISALPSFGDADAIIAMGDSLLLPLRRRPVLRVVHGSALGEALSAKSALRRLAQVGIFVQELLSAATQPGCVAVSQNTRRHNPLVRRVIPNGIDLSSFYPDPAQKTEQPSIMFVGTLGGRKRGHQLIEWFGAHVRPRYPDATLTMVSEPGPVAEGVSYHTGVSTDELARMYRRSWVYASPSTYEGFGLPYVEAMASGTPVIAFPNPGSREVLVEGRVGVLADDAEFPTALIGLLEDATRRRALERQGLERARVYSLETMLEKYEQVLVELCGPSRSRSGE